MDVAEVGKLFDRYVHTGNEVIVTYFSGRSYKGRLSRFNANAKPVKAMMMIEGRDNHDIDISSVSSVVATKEFF